MINEKWPGTMVAFIASHDNGGIGSERCAMIYERVLVAAREAAFAGLGRPSHFDGEGIEGALLDGACESIAATLPKPIEIDVEWVNAIISARPALLMMPAGGVSPADTLLLALNDLLLDELEDEILERARELGFDIPKPMTP